MRPQFNQLQFALGEPGALFLEFTRQLLALRLQVCALQAGLLERNFERLMVPLRRRKRRAQFRKLPLEPLGSLPAGAACRGELGIERFERRCQRLSFVLSLRAALISERE